MLISLTVANYTIAKHLKLDWAGGFTSITGETGAGKSVTLDALALCLGARGDVDKIHEKADQLSVTAEFDVEELPNAFKMLDEAGIINPDDPYSCIIRRVIKRKGAAKVTINDHPVTVQFLKTVGALLATIHGQHAYHELLSSGAAMRIVDHFADNRKCRLATKNAFATLQQLKKEKMALEETSQAFKERQQLLTFQLNELDEFSPLEDEFTELEMEQKKLSHASELSSDCSTVNTLLDGGDGRSDGALSLIRSAIKTTEEMASHDATLQNSVDSLHSALAEIEDVSSEMYNYALKIDVDPHRAIQVEERFSKYISLSKKYHVVPEDLHQYHASISTELSSMEAGESRLDEIDSKIEEAKASFLEAASLLSETRRTSSENLSAEVSRKIQLLNMDGALCKFSVEPHQDMNRASAFGMDDVEILVSTNGSSNLKSISKVVSGGEMSRINLVIQLISAQKNDTPTLLFDEVDVGISGPTASIVGSLLKELGESTQVISITHLPQVACYGHQHYHVKKREVDGDISSIVANLHDEERVEEVARLLSGSTLTAKSLDNARELLDNGQNS